MKSKREPEAKSAVQMLDDHAQYWATLKRHLIKEGVQVGDINRMDVFDFFALLKVIHSEEKTQKTNGRNS